MTARACLRAWLWSLALLAAGGLSLAADPSPRKDPPKGIEGVWQGALKVGVAELRLVVHIANKPDGTLTGTLDSPDQGAKDLPIEAVTVKDKDVRLEMKKLRASFEGKLA